MDQHPACQAVMALHDPMTSQQVRREANQYCEQLK